MTPLSPETRIAVLARMVKAPLERPLGRIQIIKLFYFLQELKGVPLGYDFRLFNYGPFDSEVLGDLASACGLAVVSETPVFYARGYGYAITPGVNAEKFSREFEENAPVLATQVDEVVREFGGLGAAELELQSTILFVDREWSQAGVLGTDQTLTSRVREIKPHFTEDTILARLHKMKEKGWIESVRGSTGSSTPA